MAFALPSSRVITATPSIKRYLGDGVGAAVLPGPVATSVMAEEPTGSPLHSTTNLGFGRELSGRRWPGPGRGPCSAACLDRRRRPSGRRGRRPTDTASHLTGSVGG